MFLKVYDNLVKYILMQDKNVFLNLAIYMWR